MKIDLDKLNTFYKSPLGLYVNAVLHDILHDLVKTMTLTKTSTVIASAGSFAYAGLLPDPLQKLSFQAYHDQTVWPEAIAKNHVVTNRNHWPCHAEEADLICMIHDLEFAENPEIYLKEAWRVLKGEGRMILIVPNRAGRWAREDNNPFGRGYPYSLDQIASLLKKAQFQIDGVERALFYPPFEPKSFVTGLYRKMTESLGPYALLQGGVFVLQISKHVFKPIPDRAPSTAQKAKQVLFPPKPAIPTSSKLLKEIR